MTAHPVQQAVALIKQGDPRQARSILVEYLKTSPDDPKAWALLARIVNEPRYKEELLKRVLALPDDGSGVYQWASKEISKLRFGDAPDRDPNITQAATATQELAPAYELDEVTPMEDTTPHPVDDLDETRRSEATRPFASITGVAEDVEPDDETQIVERTRRLPQAQIDEMISTGASSDDTLPEHAPRFDDEPVGNTARRIPLWVIVLVVAGLVVAGGAALLLGGGIPGVALGPASTPTPEPTLAPTDAPTAVPTVTPTPQPPTLTPEPSPTPIPRLSVDEVPTRLLEAPAGLVSFGERLVLTERVLAVGAVAAATEEEEPDQPLVLLYEVTGESLTEEVAIPYDGTSFIVEGDTAAVTTASGVAIYAYSPEEGWQEQTLLEGDVGDSVRFGASLALFGDVLAVGAVDEAQDDPAPGEVFVYERDEEGEWQQVTVLTNEADTADGYAAQMVTNGQTIAVGAAEAETPEGVPSGVVYLYTLQQGDWLLRTLKYEQDGQAGDRFGAVLALNDRTLAVGVPRPNSDEAGHLVLYDDLRGQAEWEQVEPVVLDVPNTADPAGFASQVAVADETVITTAPLDASAVLVYIERSNIWRLDRALTSTGDVLYVPTTGPLATNGGLIAVVAPDVLGGPPAILLFELAAG